MICDYIISGGFKMVKSDDNRQYPVMVANTVIKNLGISLANTPTELKKWYGEIYEYVDVLTSDTRGRIMSKGLSEGVVDITTVPHRTTHAESIQLGIEVSNGNLSYDDMLTIYATKVIIATIEDILMSNQ